MCTPCAHENIPFASLCIIDNGGNKHSKIENNDNAKDLNL